VETGERVELYDEHGLGVLVAAVSHVVGVSEGVTFLPTRTGVKRVGYFAELRRTS